LAKTEELSSWASFLFEAFRELLKKYDEGSLDKGRIMEIQEKNNFRHKPEVIRKKRDHLN
jgi:hypothetical protein